MKPKGKPIKGRAPEPEPVEEEVPAYDGTKSHLLMEPGIEAVLYDKHGTVAARKVLVQTTYHSDGRVVAQFQDLPTLATRVPVTHLVPPPSPSDMAPVDGSIRAMALDYAKMMAKADEAVKSLAKGMDLPPEVLTPTSRRWGKTHAAEMADAQVEFTWPPRFRRHRA